MKTNLHYDSMFEYDDDLTPVVSYDVLGELPDPFAMDDGSRVKSHADWERRRREIFKTAVELQYGTIPPKPAVLKVEKTFRGANTASYRITAGTRKKQVSFMMKLILPPGVKNPRVVVDGDLCFNYAFDKAYTDEFISRGIAYATFNRTELANDVPGEGRRQGPLYGVYPRKTFGALAAWAWGYSRCVDALEQIGGFDLSLLAFTGHSRGGKTAMLAGVLDERAKIVNPNDTNAGSCSCYRIHSSGRDENGEVKRSEQLDDIMSWAGFWFGPGLARYAKREEALPFDCHFLKALVAPRVLLLGEAASDMWTNPVGSWQTSMAATEVFKFLGCPENFRWYFRKGFHFHHPADGETLANLISSMAGNEPLAGSRYYRTPFKKPARIFKWRAPKM